MSDFRFNFLSGDDDEGGDEVVEQPQGPAVPERPAVSFTMSANELESIAKSSEGEITAAEFCNSDVCIRHIESADVQADIQILEAGKESDPEEESDCARAIHQHSDLIPGIYEGGLKIWECSRDLVEHLHKSAVEWEGKRVLEIGCGAALPGLYALLMGARAVDFQDYNEEVLRHVTVPNVAANMLNAMQMKQSRLSRSLRRSSRKVHQDQKVQKPQVRLNDAAKALSVGFFAGDWGKLQEMFSETVSSHKSRKYDVILTSETIYREDAQTKLLELIKCCLAPHGVVFLAAKCHYFGVGGSVCAFEKALRLDGCLSSEVVYKGTGQGVMREILEMKWLRTHT